MKIKQELMSYSVSVLKAHQVEGVMKQKKDIQTEINKAKHEINELNNIINRYEEIIDNLDIGLRHFIEM